MNPGPDWTPEERLDLIGALTCKAQEERFINRERLYDYIQRIRMVAIMPPAFLEVNRQAILQEL